MSVLTENALLIQAAEVVKRNGPPNPTKTEGEKDYAHRVNMINTMFAIFANALIKNYDESRSYVPGQAAVESGILYRCTVITTGTPTSPEPFDLNKWEPLTTVDVSGFQLVSEKNQPLGYPGLDLGGEIDPEQLLALLADNLEANNRTWSSQKIKSYINSVARASHKVDNIAQRDALVTAQPPVLDDLESVFVVDATADTTVTQGWAIYQWFASTSQWVKITSEEDLDIDLTLYLLKSEKANQSDIENQEPNRWVDAPELSIYAQPFATESLNFVNANQFEAFLTEAGKPFQQVLDAFDASGPVTIDVPYPYLGLRSRLLIYLRKTTASDASITIRCKNPENAPYTSFNNEIQQIGGLVMQGTINSLFRLELEIYPNYFTGRFGSSRLERIDNSDIYSLFQVATLPPNTTSTRDVVSSVDGNQWFQLQGSGTFWNVRIYPSHIQPSTSLSFNWIVPNSPLNNTVQRVVWMGYLEGDFLVGVCYNNETNRIYFYKFVLGVPGAEGYVTATVTLAGSFVSALAANNFTNGVSGSPGSVQLYVFDATRYYIIQYNKAAGTFNQVGLAILSGFSLTNFDWARSVVRDFTLFATVLTSSGNLVLQDADGPTLICDTGRPPFGTVRVAYCYFRRAFIVTDGAYTWIVGQPAVGSNTYSVIERPGADLFPAKGRFLQQGSERVFAQSNGVIFFVR